MARIPNPLYSHADASPCPLRYPRDWRGVEPGEKKHKTKSKQGFFYGGRNGASGPGVLFGQGEVPAWEWGARRALLASQGWRAVLPGRYHLPAATMQGQPGRARVAGYLAATLALKAGPGFLPPHARSWSGAGQWRAGPGAVMPSTRSCGGRMPPHLGHGRLLPGRTRARRSLRARLLPRRDGGASRVMGRYLRAMAGPPSPQAPAGGGAGYWPLPGPARTWKPRRWAAIRGPRPGLSAPTAPAAGVAGYSARDPGQRSPRRCRHQIRQVGAATKPVCSGPGRAGLLQGRKVPAIGADPESVMICAPPPNSLIRRRRPAVRRQWTPAPAIERRHATPHDPQPGPDPG